MEPSAPLAPPSHTVDIAGVTAELPILPVGPRLAIASFVMLDQTTAMIAHIGRALAARLNGLGADIVVGAATLGIPVAIETARALGLERFVIAQKSPKFYLRDALEEKVRSVTSTGEQSLRLDRRSLPLIAERKVVLVDDVIATGSSMAALIRLVRRAGGRVVAIGTVLTETTAWREALGADADLVVRLGHIPQFEIAGDRARVIPGTGDTVSPGEAPRVRAG